MLGTKKEVPRGIQRERSKNRKYQHDEESTNTKQQICNGEDDYMEVLGYRQNVTKLFFTWLGYLSTLGMLRLVFHWYPQCLLKATHDRCPLKDAEKVLIVDDYQGHYKSYFVKEVKTTSICDISLRDIINLENISNNEEKSNFIPKTMKFNLEDGSHRDTISMRYFCVKKICFIWDSKQDFFLKLVGLDVGMVNESFHDFIGFNAYEQFVRRLTYGPNEISVPVQSITKLIILEALTPFYIFQVFTLVVWLAEYYYYYTVAIIIMSLVGIGSSIIQTRKNQLNLRGTIHSMEMARVCRGNGVIEDVVSTNLVPGDLLLIPAHGCIMNCDAVLLEGNCIVNESMLTGESVPVMKSPIPKTNAPYNIKECANSTLFCGTKVIQTRFYGSAWVRAVVIRTGYLTTKGQLVRSILYPPPVDFKFDRDSYRFIIILAVIAMLGFLYTVISKLTRGLTIWDITIKGLDIITIVVPPALPAAMTVGKLYAVSRLKKRRIFCINSRIINVCGSINCVCFDKTGTLTEDGLDMWGVVPTSNGKLDAPIKNARNLPHDSQLLHGMASCHSLTIIDNQLTGDPLDVKMFESTGWVIDEPDVADTAKFDLLAPTVVKSPHIHKRNSIPDDNTTIEISTYEIGIIEKYQFSSTLQRMSVVVRLLGQDYYEVYCKGSPEMIISLCKPESVPMDVVEVLKGYTEQGYRVIAMAKRNLIGVSYSKITKMHRDQLEIDLTYLGLIILENQVKDETPGVIETLKKANIKITMITGDNIQTALSVARECGIIGQKDKIFNISVNVTDKAGVAKIEYNEVSCTYLVNNESNTFQPSILDVESEQTGSNFHIAMTGKVWMMLRKHCPEMIPKLITKGTVFARMTGEQKQQLIQELQAIGYYVAMCGDGANDCGALKAAHTGISLSEAESSVASPFTSQDPNISCVPHVIREGRAALVTSFGIFKFMVAYSLTEFLSVIILYGIDSNLTSLQFLFIDICLVLNFASFFGKTEAYPGPMSKIPPMTSLLSLTPLMSLTMYLVIISGFQYGAYFLIQTFDWFVPFHFQPENTQFYTGYENYAVFTISLFQYIITALIFSKGKPYRKPIYTNWTLTISIIVTTAICAYITMSPAEWILNALEMMLPPDYTMRIIVLGLAAVNALVCCFVEDFFVQYIVHGKLRPRLHNLERSRKKYLKIQNELRNSKWPLISCSSIDVEGRDSEKSTVVIEHENSIL